MTWRASAEGSNAALAYSKRRWCDVDPGVASGPESGNPVDVDALSGGDKCLFELIVTDGFTKTRMQSGPFVVVPKGWVLWILAPAPDAIIESGEAVSLAAQGYHPRGTQTWL